MTKNTAINAAKAAKIRAKPASGTNRVKARKHVLHKPPEQGREFHTWFRGDHTNFNPNKATLAALDGVSQYVLHGWLPEKPLITPQTQITAFGSCFATNISNWLSARNYRVLNKAADAGDAYVVSMGEGMVNSFVIRQQFEWAWENKVFEQALWHGYKAEAFGYDEKVRLETKRLFDETEVFILTFGLSEVWYDAETENVFWRTIPKDVYDPARHKFRVSTVAENRDNITAIHDLIRKHRPDAKIITSLSPIPLIATFRDVACLTANSVSKSVLRVALDEVMRDKGPEGHIFYWPSYELITDVFHLPYMADRRHLEPPTLAYIMTLFEHVWCAGDAADKPSLLEAWVVALATTGQLPRNLSPICRNRKPDRLDRLDHILKKDRFDPDPEINAAKRALVEQLRDGWLAQPVPAG